MPRDRVDCFLTAIASDDQDTATPLVLADWLEERDDARATLLRRLMRPLRFADSMDQADDSFRRQLLAEIRRGAALEAWQRRPCFLCCGLLRSFDCVLCQNARYLPEDVLNNPFPFSMMTEPQETIDALRLGILTRQRAVEINVARRQRFGYHKLEVEGAQVTEKQLGEFPQDIVGLFLLLGDGRLLARANQHICSVTEKMLVSPTYTLNLTFDH